MSMDSRAPKAVQPKSIGGDRDRARSLCLAGCLTLLGGVVKPGHRVGIIVIGVWSAVAWFGDTFLDWTASGIR